MATDSNKPSDITKESLAPPTGKPSAPGKMPGAPGAAPDTYEALQEAQKPASLFGRLSASFQDVLQSSRGSGAGTPIRNVRSPVQEAGEDPHVTADDLAIRRARGVRPQKMIVPEGVTISGSMSSGSETDISGRIEGDVVVDGYLHLGASALVSGNVRASSCRVEGLVEGKMECTEELDLGPTGRLNADAMAGKRITLAGQVFGNITTGGGVRLQATTKLTGDIRARSVVIEEGATFNGRCTMRPPAQRGDR